MYLTTQGRLVFKRLVTPLTTYLVNYLHPHVTIFAVMKTHSAGDTERS